MSTTGAASVSAAPELRDFKKEATAFVPSALKRKKAGSNVGVSKINAAPTVEGDDESPAEVAERPDLVSTLRSQFGPVRTKDEKSQKEKGKEKGKGKERSSAQRGKDDYEKFLDEMSDILGPGTGKS